MQQNAKHSRPNVLPQPEWSGHNVLIPLLLPEHYRHERQWYSDTISPKAIYEHTSPMLIFYYNKN